jgi:hypothetical protein
MMRHLVEGMVDKAWAVHNFSHEVARWREDLDVARLRTDDITSNPAEVDNLASAV